MKLIWTILLTFVLAVGAMPSCASAPEKQAAETTSGCADMSNPAAPEHDHDGADMARLCHACGVLTTAVVTVAIALRSAQKPVPVLPSDLFPGIAWKPPTPPPRIVQAYFALPFERS